MKTTGLVIVVGLVIATVLFVGLLSLVRHDQTVGPGGEILWDDFGFSVGKSQTVSELGPDDHLVHPSGQFVIVDLNVTNHAKRVDYDTSKHTVVLFDDEGNEYRVDPWAQAALESTPGWTHRPPRRLAAGAAWVTQLVFDVPKNAHGLYLKISWGGAFIDTVDDVVFGDRRMQLAASVRR